MTRLVCLIDFATTHMLESTFVSLDAEKALQGLTGNFY